MTGYISYITNCLALMLEYSMLVKLFMTKRVISKKQLVGLVAIFLGGGVLNRLEYQPMFYLAVVIIMLNILYKGSYKRRILAWTVCVGIGVFVELLTYSAVGKWGLFREHVLDYLMYAINITLVYIITKLFKKTSLYFEDASRYDDMSYIQLVNVVAVMTSLCLISIVLSSGNIEKQYIFARKELKFILSYAVCSTIILSILLIYKFKREHAKALVDLQRDYVSKHLERCNQLDDLEVEKMRIQELANKHLVEVKELAAAGREEELNEALENMLNMNFSEQESIETGNPIMDAIISEKYQLAKTKAIKVSTRVGTLPVIQVELVDLCAIVANSLDFAIMLSEKLSERHRKLKIECVNAQGRTLIRIGFNVRKQIQDGEVMINHIRQEIVEQNLSSIKEAVNVCDGDLEIIREHKWYELKIYLN